MTKKEYYEKRNVLENEAQNLINNNKLDSANAKMEEIKALDDQWDAITRAQANFSALSEEQPPRTFGWENGEVLDNISGQIYSRSGGEKDNMFLNKNKTMLDVARENNRNQYSALYEQGSLGNVVRGIVTGQWSSDDLKNVVTTTSSGTLIPQVLSAQIIDLARDISLFTAAGVPVAPMESNNLKVSRIKTDPTFLFKEEGKEAANESSFELDSVELKAKTCYGYAYVTLESIQSSGNLDGILRQVFAAAMANAIDKAMLYGQTDATDESKKATYAPSGIMNDTEILVTASGTTVSYDDIIKAAGLIKQNNGTASVWAANAETDQKLSILKDTNGQYLTPPVSLSEMKKIVSNQLSSSDGLVFDPDSMLIGLQNNLQIKIIEDGECLKKGLVGFQIFSMLDCKVIRPKAICKITGIK